MRNWKRLEFPKVLVQYGEPFRLEQVDASSREEQQAGADYILERIRALHTNLATKGYRAAAREYRAQRARDEADRDDED